MTREICKRCGRINRVGFDVPDDVWERATNNFQGVLCLSCFGEYADESLIPWDKNIKFYPVSFASLANAAPAASEPEPIPADVYYSRDAGNFYSLANRKGMGVAFFNQWESRRYEFPEPPPDPLWTRDTDGDIASCGHPKSAYYFHPGLQGSNRHRCTICDNVPPTKRWEKETSAEAVFGCVDSDKPEPECTCGYCMSCQERGVPFPEDGSEKPEPLRVEVGKLQEIADILNSYCRHRRDYQGSSCKVCKAWTMLDDLIREVPAPVPVGEERCDVCGWPLAESIEKGCVKGNCSQRPVPTTPAPPKFKVGDEVIVGDLGRAKVVGLFENERISVEWPRGGCDVFTTNFLRHATPTPRTIELFDGAAYKNKYDDLWLYIRAIDGELYIKSSKGYNYRPLNKPSNHVDWSRWERDPSRDQHPVGSEWVYQNGGPDSVYALNRRGYDGKYRLIHIDDGDNGWHATIAEATRGARRCDTTEIQIR